MHQLICAGKQNCLSWWTDIIDKFEILAGHWTNPFLQQVVQYVDFQYAMREPVYTNTGVHAIILTVN